MDRISAVCSLIRPCGCLADIGCDHGLVARYALDNGVKEVIAADISEGSLKKAKKLLDGYPNVTYRLSDGFDGIEKKADVAVISGMGGRTIADILSRLTYKPQLILGAQHNQKELREFLIQNGYAIEEDFCVCDRGKFYDFMRANEGQSPPLSAAQLYYGVFYKRKNPDLKAYMLDQKAILESYKPTQSILYKVELVKEVLIWQE